MRKIQDSFTCLKKQMFNNNKVHVFAFMKDVLS